LSQVSKILRLLNHRLRISEGKRTGKLLSS
jgi:hypothetical protein